MTLKDMVCSIFEQTDIVLVYDSVFTDAASRIKISGIVGAIISYEI